LNFNQFIFIIVSRYSHGINIRNQFIKELVLPKERILGWVKYDTSLEFDNFMMSFSDPSDGLLDFLLKNRLKLLLMKLEKEKRTISVPRKDLLQDGFFGFTCKYVSIPKQDATYVFNIDLRMGATIVESYSLETRVVRPIIELRSENLGVLDIASHSPPTLQPTLIELHNTGFASANSINLSCKSKTRNIKVSLKSLQRIKETYGFFKDTLTVNDFSLEIQGSGSGVIQFVIDYKDDIGNSYQSFSREIPIFIEQQQTIHLPLTQIIKSDPITVQTSI
jgi:hypothetical protein